MILEDIALIIDCPHSTAPDEGEGYPLIRTPNIGRGRLLLEGVHRVSNEVYAERNKRVIPQENDILFAREASPGNAAIITKGLQVCMGQRTVLIRPDLEKVDPQYLVYYLLAPNQQANLLGYSHGSTVGHVNIPDIKKLPIELPSIEHQKRIASILVDLDNYIENNTKRIKLLEQMAESLYKEWFVRFRFPGSEKVVFVDGLPIGWKRDKLRSIASEIGCHEKKENRNRYDYYIPIDCISSHSMALVNEDSIENAESSLVKFSKGNILFGAMRPYFHKVVMAPFDGLTRTTCFVIKANNDLYSDFLYLLLFQKTTVDFATTVSVGSTMPYVRWEDFNRLSVIIPTTEIVSEFSNIVKPIIKQIEELVLVNKNLIKQRDLLLPRLISGRLKVT